jgi:hypothetical protein
MTTPTAGRERALRAAIWVPGLLVAIGAAIATAHGLYEVAVAARVPEPIAWLYPLITDGLALVAYASTARLTGPATRYAWSVVVVAAGLSGLAQASYLAGGVATAPAVLRFGVGAWPALAAAIVAHLLYLLLADNDASADEPSTQAADSRPVPPERPAVQPEPVTTAVQATAVQPPSVPAAPAPATGTEHAPPSAGRPPAAPTPSPAKDRARSAARRHAAHHGALPTVSALADLADVARGTAAAALKELRQQPAQLHAVHPPHQERTQP